MANGYVRYGNSIHLDGFQILDFCIENAISLESLSDRNLGRKVFLTGNDTNEGYLRENVWDGTRWRAAAYLDDIDKITNGEGSLGTRVKALEDMLGLQDVTDVIDTWNDVKEFFKDVDEGLNLMTMLDGKLGKTGGTMTGNLVMENSAIRFTASGDGGYLSYSSSKGFFVANNAWDKEYTLLHSGNVGDYALKIDGSNKMTGGLQLLTMNSGSANVAVTEGLFIYRGPSSGGTDVGLPDNYINVFNVGGTNASSNLQLAWSRDYPNPTLYARIGESTNYSDWKVVAFTDSDITGNAATATALKNKVSLWGNEFDGTQDISGALYFNRINAIEGGENTLSIGWGFREKMTDIYGGTIRFKTKNVSAMTITDGGNVNIGTAFEGFKFSVYDGMTFLHGVESSALVLGQMPTNGLLVGNPNYGICQWFKGGQGYIQVGRFDGTATAYDLNLNPLGGAVNVGEGGLNVYGQVVIGTTNRANLYFGRNSANYIWADLEGGYFVIGVKDTGETNGANASLIIRSTSVTPGDRNNAVSLGTSSYRWSDVYSVGGNFSGRVLIGGAVDDADYALNVKGDSYFGGTVYIPTGQKLTIGSVTFEEDAAGRVKVDGDMYTTGTLASGGKAKEGTGTGSGSANVRDFELPADGKTTYDCDHLLKSKNVIVQVFEKAIQNNIEVWEMILTDVTIVTEDRVTVTFGRPTTKVHRVHIIGGNVS